MGPSRWGFLIAVGDVVLTFGAYVFAFLLRFGGFPARNWGAFLEAIPYILLGTLVMMVLYNQYRDLHRPFFEVAGGGILASFSVALIAGLAAYLNIDARPFPRSIWVLGGIIQSILIPLWRAWFVRDAKQRYFRRPAVIVTEDHSDVHLPPFIRVTERLTAEELAGQRPRHRDCLVIVASDVTRRAREVVLEWAAQNSVDVYLLPKLHDVLLSSAHVSQLGDRPVFSIRPLAVPPEYRWFKRALDLTVSLVIALFLAPIWVLIPFVIYLDSRGPVLFRQERVGERGRHFTVLKFRTMVVDAERETGPVWSSADDPRVTRVGKLLRATRLDELPQLINVLKGEMSLVGPRPERPIFVQEFADRNPNFRLRELVKPGLTGLAQVMGRYDTSPEDKLRYDLLYIARYSPWLDLRILLWTVQVVLFPQSWIDQPPKWVQGLDWTVETTRHAGMVRR